MKTSTQHIGKNDVIYISSAFYKLSLTFLLLFTYFCILKNLAVCISIPAVLFFSLIIYNCGLLSYSKEAFSYIYVPAIESMAKILNRETFEGVKISFPSGKTPLKHLKNPIYREQIRNLHYNLGSKNFIISQMNSMHKKAQKIHLRLNKCTKDNLNKIKAFIINTEDSNFKIRKYRKIIFMNHF